MQQVSNQSSFKRNMFYLPKDVFCPNHQTEKIEWINLRNNCKNRLYCNQCQRPQDQQIVKYKDIFHKFLPDKEGIQINFLVGQLEKVKKIIFRQFEQIVMALQQLKNFYQHNINPFILHNLIHPLAEFNYENLQELSDCLSQKVIFQNDSFSFIPEVSQEHNDKLNNLLQCIKLYQKCAIQVQAIGPFTKNETFDLSLCRSLQVSDIQAVQNPIYQLAIQKEMEFEISAIELLLGEGCVAIAGIQDKLNHQIQILELDFQNMQITKQIQILQGHKSKIKYLGISGAELISIDTRSVIIFWAKLDIPRYWVLGREFNAQMTNICCFEYDFYNNILILGGQYLQLWKLHNQNQIHPINLIEPNSIQPSITCISSKRQKLLSGDASGTICIFEEINQNWQLTQELKASEEAIRHIGFTSQNDFISISFGNISIKWTYFPDTGYDFCIKRDDNLDSAILIKEISLMINPITISIDQNNQRLKQRITSDLSFFCNNGTYMAVSQNNTIKIYVLFE